MNESLRLFLVEDDDKVAGLIRTALERVGHQVTRCRSAADALIVIAHSTFDLVLLDQRLPDMPGLDLLDALAREGIATPALMVTASGDEALATRVLQAGALDYIVKDPAQSFLAELPKRVQASVARHQLQLTNRILIEALESARDGIMITDLQGTITHVNQALERMTGYARSELIGQNPRILKDDRNPPAIYAEIWRAILARGSWQGELTNKRKDGSVVEISLTVSPIVDNHGQLTHFVGIHREMTERKFLERQLMQAQKMQSVGTLAGGVSHEFNNLLAGINGYAALGLREASLAEPLRTFLRHILELSERAAGLTRQLLAYARKPALVRRPTDLGALLRETAELVTGTMHVDVRVDVPQKPSPAEEFPVEADSNQLQQALVNLAINARDASSGGVPIIFRLRNIHLASGRPSFPESVPAGDYVVLDVIDRGSGMTPEVLNQALDPFFTTKPVGKGTGLGLPMVFGIVRGHQGFLTIDSAPDKGTSVSIYLPRRVGKAGDGEVLDFESGQIVEPESVPGRTILVLDDEEAVRDVVRRFLEIAGHKVICAATGQDALALVGPDGPIDLVILDLMMPRDDGFGVYRRLREQRPDLPILLCTALLNSDPALALAESGEAALIRKPFRMNELWYAVNEALAAKKG
jgi:two-component system, cell cycle sensor histidine kinase and response regulator CckA